ASRGGAAPTPPPAGPPGPTTPSPRVSTTPVSWSGSWLRRWAPGAFDRRSRRPHNPPDSLGKKPARSLTVALSPRYRPRWRLPGASSVPTPRAPPGCAGPSMDKNKIIEGAAKLVAKGAFDKAIREYQKVLDLDPRDVRVLQKIGELYQKKGDNPQAASFFTRVAEVYAQDGFFLKAVALYKQVLKLNPDLVEINVKLAELHQHLGLMTEAMAFFQVVVAHHERKGDTKATFATLKKMVDLDRENVSSRLKLAELYAREQMGGEALTEFKRSADWLERNNRPDERLRVLERTAALEPDNVNLARNLAHDYLARGDHKRALAKLQLCFKADPRDIPTLNLLAQAFTALNHVSKTLSVYKELAKLYAERNQHAEARDAWGKIERLDPADADLVAWKHSQRPAA